MNRKPYTYSDRLAIETMLDEGKSIKEIEYDIKRPSSGIIKEINKHGYYKFPSFYNSQHPCLKWKTCNVGDRECYLTCKNVKYKVCPKLEKTPHVCNGCTTKNGCRFVKKYYNARMAHDTYKEALSNSRIGLHYNNQETIILKEILCPLIIKSKSVYHAIMTVNKIYNTTFVLKTIYRQIKNNHLPITSCDLPRSHKKSQREKKDNNYKRDIEGHTYEDYNNYKKDNLDVCETQMDTVEGIKENNAPVLLTLEIVKIKFLFIFKIDSQTIDKVKKQLECFRDIIHKDTFNIIMNILLTDNGHEFINTDEILSISNEIHLFYCHPYSSYEKGSIENSHELIRRVIPKGVSLKPYTQKELNLLCSHINSLCRESLDGSCPFDLIDKYIPIDKITALGLSKICPLNVCLIPELLGDKNTNNIKKYLDKDDIEKANIKFIKQ